MSSSSARTRSSSYAHQSHAFSSPVTRLATHYQAIIGIGDLWNAFIVLDLNLQVLLADIDGCLIFIAIRHGRNGV